MHRLGLVRAGHAVGRVSVMCAALLGGASSQGATEVARCAIQQSEEFITRRGEPFVLSVSRCQGDSYAVSTDRKPANDRHQQFLHPESSIGWQTVEARQSDQISIAVGSCSRAKKSLSGPIVIVADWRNRTKVDIDHGLKLLLRPNSETAKIEKVSLGGVTCFMDEP